MSDNVNDLSNQETGLLIETKQIVDGLMQEHDVNKTKDLVHLFNLNQSKKNVLRAIKYSDLLDKITEQMVSRVENKADCFSNDDLLKYMTAIQASIEKAGKSVDTISESPAIQINHNNQVNVSIVDPLDRESREKISEVIKAIMASGSNPNDIILDASLFKEVEDNSNGQD